MDMAYKVIIDESNWREHIGENGVLEADHHNAAGERRLFGCKPRMSKVGSAPGTTIIGPDFKILTRADIIARAKDIIASGNTIRAQAKRGGLKTKNQSSTNYCHANSPAQCVQIRRMLQGEPYVELSAGSVGGPVTGYKNDGAVIEDDLAHIVKFGIASTEFVPANQIKRNGWKPGAEANALLHRCTHWLDIGYKDERTALIIGTLLVTGNPVCSAHNWWAHAVTLTGVVPDGNRLFFEFWNSWGDEYGDEGFGLLDEGKGTPDYSYVPLQATASLS